jgi:hydroxymethylglutaryl-CoA reductase
MQSFLSFKRDGDEVRATVYFGPEAYSVAPAWSDAARSSRLSGFFRLGVGERLQKVAAFAGLAEDDLQPLRSPDGLPEAVAEQMSENVVGRISLPVGVATNFRINGRDHLVPMAIEEPSVVAAASNAAKLLRAGAGIRAHAADPVMIGQLHFPDPPPAPVLEELLEEHLEELRTELNRLHPSLVAAGGGFRGGRVRRLLDPDGRPLAVVHLHIDVRDAMGANAVNSMAEEAAELFAGWTGKRVGLRILSNLPLHRKVRVEARVRLARGGPEGTLDPDEAQRIEEASRFAEADPYRAVTANKGIMNGIDAVLLATGQDFRAVEAAAHAYAAYEGRYTALARWRVDHRCLHGSLELPLALGVVGGITTVHPVVRANLRVLGVEDARSLAQVVAAVGLAQNLAATRALATDGIQRGHMRLHARTVAMRVGATVDEAPRVVEAMIGLGRVSEDTARKSLAKLRAQAG